MPVNQYAVYRVNMMTEGKKIWKQTYAYTRINKLPVVIENYKQLHLEKMNPKESSMAIGNKVRGMMLDKVRDPIGVSDVLVINRTGEIECFYIDQAKLQPLPGFIRINTAGAVIDIDTKAYEIKDYAGKWNAVDALIIDGSTFYLMENQKYPKESSAIILNAYGKIISDDCRNGFDDKTKQLIRKYLYPEKVEKPQREKINLSNSTKNILGYQKALTNGTYERAKESGTEQNYNMIDGNVNNLKSEEESCEKVVPFQKKKQKKKRTSVIAKLHQKQIAIAKRSGQAIPLYLQQEAERNRK